MRTQVVLSVVGSDRPGLTQVLSEAVLSAGGNWLESHLSRLGGKYVGSVLVELDEAGLSSLKETLSTVDELGLRVLIVPAADELSSMKTILEIELVGQDQPGIVHEVTRVLARLRVNIDSFVTVTEDGSWSGQRLFRLKAEATIPEGTTTEEVRQALEAISGDVMVDFTFSASPDAQ